MIQSVPFQTRARTVDHLGREQIADCPTAVSELWKNSFDAYARSVELNIYDGDPPVATVLDDGHGMNREEFIQRWLVVGTESKAAPERQPTSDRNGLPVRPRQGQKGIGRLSCANLGPVLLLISKRTDHPFVCSLLDWRLFENPFLNLSDIEIPVIECRAPADLLGALPNLYQRLAHNVTCPGSSDRAARVTAAWTAADELFAVEHASAMAAGSLLPSQRVLSTIERTSFDSRHFDRWSVWNSGARHGTALLIADIGYDLRVHLASSSASDTSAVQSRKRFQETLSSFVDPFTNPLLSEEQPRIDFSYAVHAWEAGVERPRAVVSSERQFDRRQVDEMEHRIVGEIDDKGVFSGRVKAFGDWVPDLCTIRPPQDLSIPHRRESRIGPFDIYIASMEFNRSNTTHSAHDFQRFRDLASQFSGFMIFRDGLRVLPYGRADNDFFEIESRRSRHAGREFWNHRQMFGRIGISRAKNPNLRDKAGREGLLDNRAAKTLKALVSNILMASARSYFGSASELRQELLPGIASDNKKKKAADAAKKMRDKYRREFDRNLQRALNELPDLVHEIDALCSARPVTSGRKVLEMQQAMDSIQNRLADLRPGQPPKNLGRLRDAYADYQVLLKDVDQSFASLRRSVDERVERVDISDPHTLLRKRVEDHRRELVAALDEWNRRVRDLQRDEYTRIGRIGDQRIQTHRERCELIASRLRSQEIGYKEASELLVALRTRISMENGSLYKPYIHAMESLRDSIDLEELATFGVEEMDHLHTELDRLNGLAQLGIAVEITAHDLQDYDDIIGSGLRALPPELRGTRAVQDIQVGYEGLTDQLRFLSPLRLAGPRVDRWITGAEIHDYVWRFFRVTFTRADIALTAEDSFLNIRVFDQPSRIYPVFLNLVNNSIYWLSARDHDSRNIVFAVVDSQVIVSDDGPGVDPADLEHLFSLFFTRKLSGGRGVGLYLARANLAAGGHTLRYVPDPTRMPLPGANFAIQFRGMEEVAGE